MEAGVLWEWGRKNLEGGERWVWVGCCGERVGGRAEKKLGEEGGVYGGGHGGMRKKRNGRGPSREGRWVKGF
ncbi:unnamed protein product [Prunus armeniaca]|uniref:Uncharacterized protein n=1 Tax=Prunus armeniaca TaxID=36596 RepID=A0A6J5XS45_PRUAR|nr:unnamed protein product [Prunus armeniaca]CAB4313978.1 unnamed protein product [Prunus armeniaca]